MRGGRNKKPSHLKVLQGTFRPDRDRRDGPKPQPIAPRPPKDLYPQARRMWEELAPVLERLALLTELDGPAFTILCEALGRWERARRRLRVVERSISEDLTREALLRIRKAEASLEGAESSWRPLAEAFGLTPLSRQRLDLPPLVSEEESELDRLMNESRKRRGES